MKYQIEYTALSYYQAVVDTENFSGFTGDSGDVDEFASWLERNGWNLDFDDRVWLHTDDRDVEVIDIEAVADE